MVIGIKIGSSLLTNGGGKVNGPLIMKICGQIAELIIAGHKVFLVSSGAVHSCPEENHSKNLRASVGWPILISKYISFFSEYGINVSMILPTDHDLKRHVVLKKTVLEGLDAGYVVIINANDAVDNSELDELNLERNLKDCADNDRLFSRVCQIVNAEIAIIGFDGQGFMLKDQKQDIVQISELDHLIRFAKGGSNLGHGSHGAETKLRVSKELTEKGIKVIWAPGRENNFIIRAANFEKGFGTRFVK